MRAASVVVGTSGHIDHGKTSLVRALTGVDLDSLPEEKERGITISLGFAPMDLPDGRRVAFVDVPGHERLVRTMVAGAQGVDAVLLCISAMEGVMPQTREHLAILDLLGVDQGAVVLTMADLVDAELLELAIEDAKDLVRGTFLASAPIVAYSSLTGQGRDALLDTLGRFEPRSRATAGPFRLPVDRAFVRPGFGTVVTGTAWSGTVRDGDAVRLLPDGLDARVRGIQVHGETTSEARAGWRVALNLAGLSRDDVPRGAMVVSGPVPATSILDVRYTHLDGAPPVADGDPVRVLLGTSERIGKLYFAEDRDEIASGSAWAQLRLDEPVAVLPKDRFILRRPSPQSTLGGGVVVDPWAPKLRKKERDRWPDELRRLAAGDEAVWLERAGEGGILPSGWAERSRASLGVLLGDRLLATSVVTRLEGVFVAALQQFHEANPLLRGANRRELRRDRLAGLTERGFDALIDRVAAAGAIRVDGALVRLDRFEVVLTPAQAALRTRMLAAITAAATEGVANKALHEAFTDPAVATLIKLCESDSAVVDVPDLGWVATATRDDVAARVRQYFAEKPEMTPADFKEITGLSRKGAIPWLEWLDKNKLTKRVGDVRRAGAALGVSASG
jgi:selenocysteine-specific elongation factor